MRTAMLHGVQQGDELSLIHIYDPLIETDTIGLKGSPTNVYKSFAPPVKGAGMKVEDAAQRCV